VDEEFEENRERLRAVARRMLGSADEAEDALQQAWLRASRAGRGGIANPRAWLTTVVARVCLDMLRARAARREVRLGELRAADPPAPALSPERGAELADSVGTALHVVLQTLTPAERVAFVLHDLFAVPFAEIAPVLGRSLPATKMLASRARRRCRGAGGKAADASGPGPDPARCRRSAEAFFAASRNGDFTALMALLDPKVVVRADREAAPLPVPVRISGARCVARRALVFAGRAQQAPMASSAVRPQSWSSATGCLSGHCCSRSPGTAESPGSTLSPPRAASSCWRRSPTRDQ